jgi:hypothetical protein
LDLGQIPGRCVPSGEAQAELGFSFFGSQGLLQHGHIVSWTKAHSGMVTGFLSA